MLTLEQARNRILDDLRPLGAESVALLDAADRVIAEAICASRSLPAFDNSAMDGYALRAADTAQASTTNPSRLAITQRVSAGENPTGAVEPGTATRIFTGAPIPAGADAVVMQEKTRLEEGSLLLVAAVDAGRHVRRAGEDIAAGDQLIASGAQLRAGEIAVLAAQGRCWVRTIRKPRVAILPTGNELVEVDEQPGPGQIANSNSLSLAAQIKRSGGIPIRFPPTPDDKDALTKSMLEAASTADLVLTSGGVSVGEADFVREVLQEKGRIDFWKVAIKPGKPLAYGRIADTPLLALPGNPVSTFVCFELFGYPAIRRLAGHQSLLHPTVRASLEGTLRRNGDRRELFRAALQRRKDSLWAIPNNKQGSGQVSSMLNVDALIDLPAGEGRLSTGDEVELQILDPFCVALTKG